MTRHRDPSGLHNHDSRRACDESCPEYPDHPPAFVHYTTVPHEESVQCVGNHCYAHMVDELITDDAYQFCFECKHVYYTPRDLEERYTFVTTQMLESDPTLNPDEIVTSLPASKITFCQYCMHDWLFEPNIPDEPPAEQGAP